MTTEPPFISSTKKILLVQLFSNGDCLYATAVARQIKEDYPGCHLTWAVASYCKSILQNNPYVDALHEVERINYINWPDHWPNVWKNFKELKRNGIYDQIYLTQIIDQNFSNYDYCIRSTIFRGYGKPIKVPVQPTVILDQNEITRVEEFVQRNHLDKYKNVIIFEYSPRSGQASVSTNQALNIARTFTRRPDTAVILSSSNKIDSQSLQIIDGSTLSLRETAYLIRFCTLLIGCSSGITWISTSSAAKTIPMVQILDSESFWVNSVVEDHKRFNLPTDHVIELMNANTTVIIDCVLHMIDKGVADAKIKFHQPVKQQFKVSRGLIAYLLGRGLIGKAIKHISINIKLFGFQPGLIKSILLGVTTFPVTNYWNKRKRNMNKLQTEK